MSGRPKYDCGPAKGFWIAFPKRGYSKNQIIENYMINFIRFSKKKCGNNLVVSCLIYHI